MTVWSVFQGFFFFFLSFSVFFFHPQIAVDNGFGGVYGHQKADWMADVVQQYFHDNGEERLSSLEPNDEIVQFFVVLHLLDKRTTHTFE